MGKNTVDIGKLIDEETTRRLEVMKASDYEWPEKIDYRDTIGIIASIAVCSVLIILCMVGVIV